MFQPRQIDLPVEQITQACQQILDGQFRVMIGSREIYSLVFEFLNDKKIFEDFKFFVGVSSESDHLPVGQERRHWSQEVLQEKDKEIEKVEKFYRDEAF